MKFGKALYPITYSMVIDHPDELPEIFKRVRPHKGVFIGVCEVDGTFMCESPGELYDSLIRGERFELDLSKANTIYSSVQPLEVIREDGTVLGTLPFEYSVIPSMLCSRGVNSFCYLEAKEFKAGMLNIAVSVYCDDY